MTLIVSRSNFMIADTIGFAHDGEHVTQDFKLQSTDDGQAVFAWAGYGGLRIDQSFRDADAVRTTLHETGQPRRAFFHTNSTEHVIAEVDSLTLAYAFKEEGVDKIGLQMDRPLEVRTGSYAAKFNFCYNWLRSERQCVYQLIRNERFEACSNALLDMSLEVEAAFMAISDQHAYNDTMGASRLRQFNKGANKVFLTLAYYSEIEQRFMIYLLAKEKSSSLYTIEDCLNPKGPENSDLRGDS